ncbi:MAG TPA: SDR family oxidoreductase [Gaiellaceae bacterium]|jgi:NAD(P)-dependent dehydrogenase (short-subunit alcohol dehydrogenase family)|nr:SDR family oxidoreductase [Gaiellaceae bacterium]
MPADRSPGALEGKAAIVTGGGSGLGREIALEYAAQGAQVVVSSVVPEQDEAVVLACRELGGIAIAVPADVRSESEVAALVDRCVVEFGSLDVLVAAAGLDVRESESREDRYAANLPLSHWTKVVDTNLTGTFLSIREALRHMLPGASGSIATFSSGTVRFPRAGLAAYASTKFAIEGLTKVVAEEVRDRGVRVNAIQPGGMTDTGFFPGWTEEHERSAMHDPAVIRSLAAFVASDDSRSVTGESLIATDWNRDHGLSLCGCPACTAATAEAAHLTSPPRSATAVAGDSPRTA